MGVITSCMAAKLAQGKDGGCEWDVHRAVPVELARKVGPEARGVLDAAPVQSLVVVPVVHPRACPVID